MNSKPTPRPRATYRRISSSGSTNEECSSCDSAYSSYIPICPEEIREGIPQGISSSSVCSQSESHNERLAEDDEDSPPIRPPPRKKNPTPCPDTSHLEELRQFAKKRLYTEDEFDQAIENISGDIDTNILLAQLIAIRANSIPPELPPRSYSNTNKNLRTSSDNLRNIVIDGSNVAMTHGKGELFSCKGIQLTVDWFKTRGHQRVTVFVPVHRMVPSTYICDQHILKELRSQGVLATTPVREFDEGARITCYDDRFILKLASEENSIVVSNDQYRDLVSESAAFREVITQRRLVYAFAGDKFMPADDQFGRRGVTLEQFLRKDCSPSTQSETCPYGRRCTYGTKCKFLHPERYNTAVHEDKETLQRRQQLQQFIARAAVLDKSTNRSSYHQSKSYHYPQTYFSHPIELTSRRETVMARCITDGYIDRSRIPSFLNHANSHDNIRDHATPHPMHNPSEMQTIPMMAPGPDHIPTPGVRAETKPEEQGHSESRSDSTTNVYYHLKNLFPEDKVNQVMRIMPHEKDINKICLALLKL